MREIDSRVFYFKNRTFPLQKFDFLKTVTFSSQIVYFRKFRFYNFIIKSIENENLMCYIINIKYLFGKTGENRRRKAIGSKRIASYA